MTRTFECTNKKLQVVLLAMCRLFGGWGVAAGRTSRRGFSCVVGGGGMRSKDAGCVVAAKLIMDV